MKIQHIILALAASFSLGAYAATDAASAPMADMKGEHASAPSKAKPHSHMEEKNGVAPKTTAELAKPAPSKSRHIHPRDGK